MKKKYLLWGFIIIIIGIYFSFSYQPLEKKQQIENKVEQELKDDKDDIDTYLQGINLSLYNQDNTIEWQLEAERINNIMEKYLLNLEEIKIKVSQEQEEIYSLVAKEGNFLTKADILELSSLVEINKGEKYLEIGSLIWQLEHDLLLGEQGVKYISPHFMISGDSMQGDLSLNKLTIYGNKEKQAHLVWKERD